MSGGKAPSFNPEKRPVSTINYHIGRDQYRLVPEAITPDNVGVMMQLMIAFASMRTIGALDIAGYIDEHGLWPCFEKVVD